jgi:dienelactone hydrolase
MPQSLAPALATHHGPAASRRAGWRARLQALAALVGVLSIGTAVWHLEEASRGLDIRTQRVGSTPVTVFRPAASVQGPVVLVAHGFAGSQQLMQPFATTLARNGFVAITFDFPGHGRNPEPMLGGLADQDESLRILLASMARLGEFAGSLAGPAGYAVVGHSMASDIVVRHAQAHASGPAPVRATVGVSLFAPTIQAHTPPDSPRNLLVIDGALEPGMMAKEALRVVGLASVGASAGPPAGAAAAAAGGSSPTVSAAAVTTGITYGRFADGTARRAALSPGVEHIGVLYSAHTLAETLAWLQAAFGRPAAERPFIDARGPWLGLLLAGVVLLAWPLSRLLPRVAARGGAAGAETPLGVAGGIATATAPVVRRRWWGWRGQAVPTLLPALATPLLLWPLPSDFLPILLGDYLVLHFALYGLLTFAGLWWLGRWPARGGRSFAGASALALTKKRVRTPTTAPNRVKMTTPMTTPTTTPLTTPMTTPMPATATTPVMALIVAVALAGAYGLVAVGLPVDRYVFNVEPPPVRWPVILAMCAGTLPYFLADEWLTRGAGAARGAYLVSKVCFLVSLVLAIALNPWRLFFLAIIVPAVLLLFVIYGLFSRWAYRQTRHPAVGAIANALAFGCFIAVTFPLVA